MRHGTRETISAVRRHSRVAWDWVKRNAHALQALAAVLAVVVAAIALVTRPPSEPPDDKPDPQGARGFHTTCVAFDKYSDNKPIESPFDDAGMTFQSLHRSGGLFINDNGSDQRSLSLQFLDDGIEVSFEHLAEWVKIEVTDFHTPIHVQVLGLNGTTLDNRVIDVDNQTRAVAKQDPSGSITGLRLTGGGNEGGIREVCARMRAPRGSV